MDCDKKTCDNYIPYELGQPGFCSKENFRCIDDLKTMLPRLSHSARQQFIQCRRAYYYSQIIGLKTRNTRLNNPIKAGAIWDTFLDLKYNKEKNIKDKIIIEMDKYDLPPDLRAKLFALMRAFKSLEINIDNSGFIKSQHEITYELKDNYIIGYADRLHSNYIVESKLSSRPDFYTKPTYMESQLSTYFLALPPDLQRAVVEVTRLPSLRLKNKDKDNEEDIQQFEDRVYSDIIHRPSNYFIGWNRLKRTFGVIMYRADFDIEENLNIYLSVNDEINRLVKLNNKDAWWPNKLACNVPGPCFYNRICDTGVINENVYKYRWEEDLGII